MLGLVGTGSPGPTFYPFLILATSGSPRVLNAAARGLSVVLDSDQEWLNVVCPRWTSSVPLRVGGPSETLPMVSYGVALT